MSVASVRNRNKIPTGTAAEKHITTQAGLGTLISRHTPYQLNKLHLDYQIDRWQATVSLIGEDGYYVCFLYASEIFHVVARLANMARRDELEPRWDKFRNKDVA